MVQKLIGLRPADWQGDRLSLWWQDLPPYQGETVGYIGDLRLNGGDEGDLLAACQRLQSQGCRWAMAPINGSTWGTYRAVITPGSAPPFALEPNPDHIQGKILTAAGFQTLITYRSNLCNDVHRTDPRWPRLAQRFQSQGVEVRSPLDFSSELPRIYPLIMAAFATAPRFTPLSLAEFCQLYQPLLPRLRPELVRLATVGEQVVGFCLAFEDWCDPSGEQVVLKTLARSPRRAYAGLGAYLVGDCHQQAARLGYRRVIHALMHDRNPSQGVSDRYGQPFRRYALLMKPLLS